MPISWKASWLVPAGLVVLGLVPLAAGVVRLLGVATGAEITPENARFVAAPVPIFLHIIAVTIYAFLGAFQFSGDFRRRNPRWHRWAGRVLVPIGLIAALSGLWMSQFYLLPPHDGIAVYLMRLAVGTMMVAALVLGLLAIRRREFAQHQAWMMRAYGLGMGAGTQVITGLPWILLIGPPDTLTRAILLGAGWLINIVVVEWILAKRPRRMPPRRGALGARLAT